MRRSLLLALLAFPLAATPAFAQEEEEESSEEEEEELDIDFSDDTFDLDEFEDEEVEGDEEVERLDAPGEGESDEELPVNEDDLDFGEDFGEEDEFDFDGELEELGDDEIGGEGQDNVGIYRDFIDSMDDLGAEEELLSWESYMDDYPNTLFLDRIERRMDELTEDIYGQRIDDPNSSYKDAKDREIGLARPLVLENIDPRTHAHVAVEMGFPSYLAGTVDLEWALAREMSVHAGVRRRFTGPNFEVGAKYAFIKSSRLDLIATGMLDFRFNTNPGYPALRPQLAVGKIFDVGGGLHVLAQGGVDLEFRGQPRSMRYIGGAHVRYQANDVVSVFVEGSLNYKSSGLPEPYPNFQFHVLTFGLKFEPGKQPIEVGLSANVPVAYQYWGYHFGAVQADLVGYADDKLPKLF
ncbi:MAG: hypothetical protein ACI9VR_003644 [Cognaticolwellia sp.]|jgi:hypothetical protein